MVAYLKKEVAEAAAAVLAAGGGGVFALPPAPTAVV